MSTDKTKKTTPGRRGEKRKKSVIDENERASARSKKMGRVLMPSLSLPDMPPVKIPQNAPISDGPRMADDLFGVPSRSASTASLAGDATLNPIEQKNKSVSAGLQLYIGC